MTDRNEKNARRERARVAMQERERKGVPKLEVPITASTWNDVLAELDHAVMGHIRKIASKIARFGSFLPEASALLELGTMLREPATCAELEALEARLELMLPPSYRSFLETSNGLLLPTDGWFLPSDKISRYSEADPDGSGILEEIEEDFPEESEPEDQRYDPQLQGQLVAPGEVKNAIALNGPFGPRSSVGRELGWALLLPNHRFGDGECEIWQNMFDSHYRFRSFAKYFSEVRIIIVDSLRGL